MCACAVNVDLLCFPNSLRTEYLVLFRFFFSFLFFQPPFGRESIAIEDVRRVCVRVRRAKAAHIVSVSVRVRALNIYMFRRCWHVPLADCDDCNSARCEDADRCV